MFNMTTSLAEEERERRRPHWNDIYAAAFPNYAERWRAGINRDKAGTDVDIELTDGTMVAVQEKHVHIGYPNICTEPCSTYPTRNGWSVVRGSADVYLYVRPLPGRTCKAEEPGQALLFNAQEFHDIYQDNFPTWYATQQHGLANNGGWQTEYLNVSDHLIFPLLTSLKIIPITFKDLQ